MRKVAIIRLIVLIIGFASVTGLRADDSSRAYYILSDRPLSLLDLGFYRMDLDIAQRLIPILTDLLNTRPEQLSVRNYLTVGQKTDMELIIETQLLGADYERSTRQAKSLCDKITTQMSLFYFRNPVGSYFKSRDPFQEKLPKELYEQLDDTLRLKAIVPLGAGLPAYSCTRPLKLR